MCVQLGLAALKAAASRFNISNDAAYREHAQRKAARASGVSTLRHTTPALKLTTYSVVPDSLMQPWYLKHRPRGTWIPNSTRVFVRNAPKGAGSGTVLMLCLILYS